MEPERSARCQILLENMRILERQKRAAQDRLRAAEIEVMLAENRLAEVQSALDRIEDAIFRIGPSGVGCVGADTRSCVAAAIGLASDEAMHRQEVRLLERELQLAIGILNDAARDADEFRDPIADYDEQLRENGCF